jgi:PAS domain S-box-containing protein
MAPWRDAAKAQGYAAHASFPLTAVDGQTFGCLTLCAAEPGYFQDDEISLMLAVAGDLAFAVESRRTKQAKKRSEGLLRESEKRYRATASQLVKVLDSSLDVICSFDSQGPFVQVNKACESFWGYTAEELLATPYLDKVLTEDQEFTVLAAENIMAGSPTRSFENRYRKKNGGVTHTQWTAHGHSGECRLSHRHRSTPRSGKAGTVGRVLRNGRPLYRRGPHGFAGNSSLA